MDVKAIAAASGFETALGGPGQAAGGATGFGDLLDSAMNSLEGIQERSNSAIQGLAMGEDVDIHEVVLATELEALSFEFAIQVRNRFVETVQTVMSMQV